jgi:rhodanese-related sulfurtransferase
MNLEEITPLQSYNILKNNKSSALIDVRTDMEISAYGIADLASIDKESILLSWRNQPDMAIDSNFSAKLSSILQDKFPNIPHEDIELLFICSLGVRSREAATLFAEEDSYKCYNILEGFEGKADSDGSRSNINGWKCTLPWRNLS